MSEPGAPAARPAQSSENAVPPGQDPAAAAPRAPPGALLKRNATWAALREAKAKNDDAKLTQKVQALNRVLKEGPVPAAADVASTDASAKSCKGVTWDGLARSAAHQAKPSPASDPHNTFLMFAAKGFDGTSFTRGAPEDQSSEGKPALKRSFTVRMGSFTKTHVKHDEKEQAPPTAKFHLSSRYSHVGGTTGAKHGWLLIDPRTSKWLWAFDILSMLAIIFTALVTPFEVSFLKPPCEGTGWNLWIGNRVVDLIFTSDIIMNFFMMCAPRCHSPCAIWLIRLLFPPSRTRGSMPPTAISACSQISHDQGGRGKGLCHQAIPNHHALLARLVSHRFVDHAALDHGLLWPRWFNHMWGGCQLG